MTHSWIHHLKEQFGHRFGRGDQGVVSCVQEAIRERRVLGVSFTSPFRTRAEARIRIATWITGFYNTRRLHSVCDFKSPIDYEREYWASLIVGLAA
ncbi:hypothetical protein OG369_38740 [Streptomyces sp. NBC_01221]|uniref:hypothetical protein n=1 Tax=Streptomyces sp. NBC_01221 TaxID=2903782 RepID=UPI00225A8BC0|nr:hypothetical protein [Streptomyces sp. NBC_01221]MCX4791801.1 hypothetical protein [Streptomyces sp. NBC_01221]